MLDTSGEGLYGHILASIWAVPNKTASSPPKVSCLTSGMVLGGETQTLADGWSAELFIPWSILSMPESDAQRRLAILSREK